MQVGQCHWILELCTARVKSTELAHFSIREEVLTFVYTGIISSLLLSLLVTVSLYPFNYVASLRIWTSSHFLMIYCKFTKAYFLLFFVYSILYSMSINPLIFTPMFFNRNFVLLLIVFVVN